MIKPRRIAVNAILAEQAQTAAELSGVSLSHFTEAALRYWITATNADLAMREDLADRQAAFDESAAGKAPR